MGRVTIIFTDETERRLRWAAQRKGELSTIVEHAVVCYLKAREAAKP